MAGTAALRVRVSRSVRIDLQRMARGRRVEHRLVVRARIILHARRDASIREVAEKVGETEPTVRKWCRRFKEEPSREALMDLRRSGRPPRVPVPVRCELIKLACTKPDSKLAPCRETWTLNSLRSALRATTGCKLSRSEIHRILNTEEIRPHRVAYWLHSPDPDFRPKVDRVCSLYLDPPQGATILCVDEKTCIQALNRRHPLTPATRGKAGRFEFEYERRGTVNLLAAFNPKTGEVFGRCTRTRTANDLMHFMEQLARRHPSGRVYIIWDNLNIHHGQSWRTFSARHGGRFHFVYTPIHASWLNQVEMWFGILQRRLLRFGIFTSREDLVERLRGFIRHWNVREAHPFRWIFRGWKRNIRRTRCAA